MIDRLVDIVDDQEVVREGLRRLIATNAELTVVGECSDGDEVVEQVERSTPDVVVMDVRMRRVDGATATANVRAVAGPPVLVPASPAELCGRDRTSCQLVTRAPSVTDSASTVAAVRPFEDTVSSAHGAWAAEHGEVSGAARRALDVRIGGPRGGRLAGWPERTSPIRMR